MKGSDPLPGILIMLCENQEPRPIPRLNKGPKRLQAQVWSASRGLLNGWLVSHEKIGRA